ncbi:MAG: SDR family oxidoreductase [Spirochaetota bacterium]
MSEKVLITGSNSGFGKLMADTLLANGYTVIASMREPASRNKVAADDLSNQGAHVVEIDVTNDASVEAGVQKAIELAGGVDVLINNAGAGVLGWQENFTIDDWKKLFEINVFGVARMNRAVLPNMRKSGKGTIMYISSLLGKFCMPFFGPYNSSKHALEGLAENYRVELSQFGIESLVIEPGGFGTNFGASLLPSSDNESKQSYGDAASGPEKMMEGFASAFEGENAPNPQMVADAVLKLLQTPRGERSFRTVVDGMGWGDSIQGIADATENAHQGIYKAMQMEGLLQVS